MSGRHATTSGEPTPQTSIEWILTKSWQLLTQPRYFYVVAVPLVVFELVANVFIIRKIPYTEIDWSTYMQQIEKVINGERDYSQIYGDTGPLVYPAGFIWIYQFLYWLTDRGRDILTGQLFFMAVYMFNFAIVLYIYKKAAGIPPYALVFLSLSKRLHSIYVLRLFNDPLAVMFAYLSVASLLKRKPLLASLLLSMGISIKMSVLLWAPGLFWVLWRNQGIKLCLKGSAVIVIFQAIIAAPFLLSYPREYINGAFEFGRVFMFKWTVNWKFIDPETFVGKSFASTLLLLHGILLITFTLKIWSRPVGGFYNFIYKGLFGSSQRTTQSPDEIVAVMFMANFIGIVCARSLHYQFYSWYCHTLPYIIFSLPRLHVAGVFVYLAIEWCWNVFPATPYSSAVLLAMHTLLLGLHLKGPATSQPKRISKKDE